MKFYLIVAKGKRQGMPIPITVDLFLIGSSKECQLRSRVPGIGPQQCALVCRERKVFVRDLNSGEPTLLNGSVLPPGEEWPLHANDRLEVGTLRFLIQFREKPLSQRDLEEWALHCLDTSSEKEHDEDEDGRPLQPTHRPTNPAAAAAAILDKLQASRGLIKGRLRIGREERITVIRFNDVYLVEEAEIALITKELRDNLNRANMRVLLDCKNVKRLSTAAVYMIDELCGWLRPWGSTLVLCRVRAEIHNIFKSLPLTNQILVFPDKKTALAARW